MRDRRSISPLEEFMLDNEIIWFYQTHLAGKKVTEMRTFTESIRERFTTIGGEPFLTAGKKLFREMRLQVRQNTTIPKKKKIRFVCYLLNERTLRRIEDCIIDLPSFDERWEKEAGQNRYIEIIEKMERALDYARREITAWVAQFRREENLRPEDALEIRKYLGKKVSDEKLKLYNIAKKALAANKRKKYPLSEASVIAFLCRSDKRFRKEKAVSFRKSFDDWIKKENR